MILAHIIAKNKEQAVKIIALLMRKKLLLNAAISKKMVYRYNDVSDTLEREKQTLIIGKTKALLFSAINEELKTHFLKNMPTLYAVPIIYMDEDLADFLRANTAKV